MFDSINSTNTEHNLFTPLKKTSSDSFFAFAIKELYPSEWNEWDEEAQAALDETNKSELERKNAVSLNDLLDDNPNIKGRKVEVLQILPLNQYLTEALVEVKYL